MEKDTGSAIAAVISRATAEDVELYRVLAENAGFETPAEWMEHVLELGLIERVRKTKRALQDAQCEPGLPGQLAIDGFDLPSIIVCEDDGVTIAKSIDRATGPELLQHTAETARRQAVKHKKAQKHFEEAKRLQQEIGEPFDDLTVAEMHAALTDPITERP